MTNVGVTETQMSVVGVNNSDTQSMNSFQWQSQQVIDAYDWSNYWQTEV